MNETNLNLEEFLFEAALQRGDPVERAAFLDGVCRDSPGLRARLEVLLEGHFGGPGFLDRSQKRDTLPVTVPASPAGEPPVGMIGRYKLLEKLGEGGFGEVWMAEQKEPVKRRVALKIIKLGMDTRQVIARFEAERQALALMDHPNIARVFDGGTTETGRPYFVMELVRGIKITDYCDRNQLPTHERLKLFIVVCRAIQHAHQKGIIHRDIKPSNVLVTLHDGMPVPKVIDFGIAKATQQELTDKTMFTQFQQMIGTPAYMSPEQAEMSGLDIDTRTDIYSLGVLLYELLTGKTPLDEHSLLAGGYDEIRRRIVEEEPIKPSTRIRTLHAQERTTAAKLRKMEPSRLGRDLKGDLDWIAMKALEKDRTRRYETANGFAQDIQRYLNHEPVTAVAPSLSYRGSKFIRRNKLACAAAVTVVAALVLGITLATSQAIRAQRSAALAKQQTEKAIRARLDAEAAREQERAQREQAEANERRARELRYASDMIVAQKAVHDQDAKLGMDILEEHIPGPGEPEIRGWQWRYLRGQFALEQATVRALRALSEVVVSPDGRLLAAAGTGYEGGIRILSLPDLEILQTLSAPEQSGWIAGMRFTEQNRVLIVECNNSPGALRYDLETGERRLLAPAAEDDPVWPIRISPNQRWLVGMYWTEQGLRRLRSFDAATGRELAATEPFDVPDPWMIDHEMRFSPDGSRITVACNPGLVRIFSVPDLGEVRTLHVNDNIGCVAWSSDNQQLATGYDYPYSIDLWDVETGSYRGTLAGDRFSPAYDICFSPDGSLLASSGMANTVSVWNTDTFDLVHAFPGHRGGVTRSIHFFPDNATLASGGADGTVKLWNVSPPKKSALRIASEEHPLWYLQYSPDGRTLATSGPDGIVRLFEADTGDFIQSLAPLAPRRGRASNRAWTHQLSFSPDGRMLGAGNGDHTATVYSVDSGRPEFVLDGHTGPLANIRFAPNGRIIATTGEDDVMVLWDAGSGRELRRVEVPRFVEFLPDPRSRILALGERQGVSLLDIDTGERRSVDVNSPWSLTFLDSGRTLAVGLESEIRLYSVPGFELKATLTVARGPIPIVTATPDGSTFAIPSWGGVVDLWNTRVARGVGSLSLPLDWAISAQFSPDGNALTVSTRGAGIHQFLAPSWKQITEWQREEEFQSQRVISLDREFHAEQQHRSELRFANDAGSVNQWLLLGPVPLEPRQLGIETSHFEDESALKPVAGESVDIDGQRFVWSDHRQSEPVFDFVRIYTDGLTRVDPAMDWSVVYGVCYLECERPFENLQARIGSDDQSVLYLNGAEIHRHTVPRGHELDQDVVDGIRMNRGLNRLVFKVVNEEYHWAGSVRFTDAQGRPVSGIRTRLSPHGQLE